MVVNDSELIREDVHGGSVGLLGGRDNGRWASYGGSGANVGGSPEKTVVASSPEMKLWPVVVDELKERLIKLIFIITMFFK